MKNKSGGAFKSIQAPLWVGLRPHGGGCGSKAITFPHSLPMLLSIILSDFLTLMVTAQFSFNPSLSKLQIQLSGIVLA